MSKIVCDVCGTSYSDTAMQCPICGCVRPVSTAGTTADTESGTKPYEYVKGGRFSKANVKKRNQMNQVPVRNTTTEKTSKEKHKDNTTSGLLVTAAVLVLAIIAALIYICLRCFAPSILDNPQQLLPNSTQPEQSVTQTLPLEVPCESISFDISAIALRNMGGASLLNLTVVPFDTTDAISFSSDNTDVATVSQDGKVTAIGPGEAVITVTCGDCSDTCLVSCIFELPTEETTEETTEATEPLGELKLNRTDITFNKKNESWLLYSGEIPMTQITWTTDDQNVATVEEGKVVAVGGGVTKVYGQYGDQKVSCVIRCNFAALPVGVGGSGGGISEDGGGASTSGVSLYNPYGGSTQDVSIKVGESFILKLRDANGDYVDGVWSVEDSECCEMSGTTFTGRKAGTTTVTVTYNNEKFSCIVRVY